MNKVIDLINNLGFEELTKTNSKMIELLLLKLLYCFVVVLLYLPRVWR